jgi:hypothetical protein
LLISREKCGKNLSSRRVLQRVNETFKRTGENVKGKICDTFAVTFLEALSKHSVGKIYFQAMDNQKTLYWGFLLKSIE